MATEPTEKKEKEQKSKGVLGTIFGALGSVAEKAVPGLGFLPVKEAATAAGDMFSEGLRPNREKAAQAVLDKVRRMQPPETGAPVDSGAGARAASQSFAMGAEADSRAAMGNVKAAQDAAGKAFVGKRAADLRSFYQDKGKMLRTAAGDVKDEIDYERDREKFGDTINALQSKGFKDKVSGLGSMGREDDSAKTGTLKKY